jgi:hypothetical protein
VGCQYNGTLIAKVKEKKMAKKILLITLILAFVLGMTACPAGGVVGILQQVEHKRRTISGVQH